MFEVQMRKRLHGSPEWNKLPWEVLFTDQTEEDANRAITVLENADVIHPEGEETILRVVQVISTVEVQH